MTFLKKAVLPLLAAAVAALAFGSVSTANASSHPTWDPTNTAVETFSGNAEIEFDGRIVSCEDAHVEGNTATGDPGLIDFVSFGDDHAGGGCTGPPFTSVRSIVVDMGNGDWPLEAVDHTANPRVARFVMDQRASIVVSLNVPFTQCTIAVDGRKQNQQRGPIYADFIEGRPQQLRFGRDRNPQDTNNVWVESTCFGGSKGWGTWSGTYTRTDGGPKITMVR